MRMILRETPVKVYSNLKYVHVLYILDKCAELLLEFSIEKLEREYQGNRFGQLNIWLGILLHVHIYIYVYIAMHGVLIRIFEALSRTWLSKKE